MGRTILLGLHDSEFLGATERMCGVIGYEVIDKAESREEMLEMLYREDYDVCVMDANLGDPGAGNADSAVQVYEEILKENIEKDLTKFLVISSTSDALRDAKKMRIPKNMVRNKSDFDRFEFLRQNFD